MRIKHLILTFFLICFLILCAISWVFGGLLHQHEWLEATCTEPKTCSTCHETEGEPVGHDWEKATCASLKTCRTCGMTDGTRANLPDHTWIPATCTDPEKCNVCGIKKNGLFSFPLGHKWERATCTNPEVCSICGAFNSNSSARGHNWRNATYTNPKTCFVCGETDGEPRQDTPQYNKIQQFFISLPTDITMGKLEELAVESNLFCSSRKEIMNRASENEERFMVYTISETEYKNGSFYIGKQSNTKRVTTCVVSVFNCADDVLEYILYLHDYGPHNGFGKALYYNCGRFGDINEILWDECVKEDIGGKYYYYVRGHDSSYDEYLLNVTFRDDDDVSSYYRGRTIQTGFKECKSAEEALNYAIPMPIEN